MAMTIDDEGDTVTYHERVTAFIDILGMREHVRDPTNGGQAFVQKFVALVRAIIAGSCELPAEAPEGLAFPAIPLSGWTRTDMRDLVTTSISDSIVISLPGLHGFQPLTCGVIWPIYIVMETVFWLQRALLQFGVLSRGAIAIGDLHHSQDVVAGEALIQAYELESSLAIYPRVILAETMVDLLLRADIPEAFLMRDRIASLLTQDFDGLYFVDYLGVSLIEVEADWPVRLKRIERIVEAQTTSATQPRVLQKLGWLRSYLAHASALAARIKNPPPHGRHGRLEQRYPRFSEAAEREFR
jgi:hypothetical protein